MKRTDEDESTLTDPVGHHEWLRPDLDRAPAVTPDDHVPARRRPRTDWNWEVLVQTQVAFVIVDTARTYLEQPDVSLLERALLDARDDHEIQLEFLFDNVAQVDMKLRRLLEVVLDLIETELATGPAVWPHEMTPIADGR